MPDNSAACTWVSSASCRADIRLARSTSMRLYGSKKSGLTSGSSPGSAICRDVTSYNEASESMENPPGSFRPASQLRTVCVET